MDWIFQFKYFFLGPAGMFAVLVMGWYFMDNLSYPWKHWSGRATLGAFLLIPGGGLFFLAFGMFITLSQDVFVFERYFTAGVFLLLSMWFLRLFKKQFLGEEKSCAERHREYIAAHPEYLANHSEN